MKYLFFVMLLTGWLTSGCRSFEGDWKKFPENPQSSVTGRWTGSWQNTNNTHNGALRAVIIPKGSSDYTARFEAQWGSHTGHFSTLIRGYQTNDTFVFSGSKRIFGIKITTAGKIDHQQFKATYDSRFDTGIFTLNRPLP